jgi:hypothetical protein
VRGLKRNKRTFYYCTIQRDEHGEAVTREIVDEYGNLTGQYIVMYNAAVLAKYNVSPATGQSNTEQFGDLENYDKVIVIDDLDCPIDESSVLFIDKEPEFTEVLTHNATAVTTIDETVSVPVYDYTVLRVADSLNSISVAARKVKVS